jgi:FAD/FMN-containing dehydrogenase
LVGTSADVGLAGYTTGGGISWLSRVYGLAANNVEAIEVVTADGRHMRAGARAETDPFWALRGGGGSFGVVTALKLRLFAITEVYAGQLGWSAEAAAPVLQAWCELTQSDLPDQFTSAGRLLLFPQIPNITQDIRGRSFAIVFVSHLGTPAEADTLLAPLRALGPVTDTIQTIPIKTSQPAAHGPGGPPPSVGDRLRLASGEAQCGRRARRHAAWAARQMYLNVADASCDPASFRMTEAYDRLRSNHPVPPHNGR